MANKITTLLDLEDRGFRNSVKDFKRSISEADGATGKFKAGWASAMDSFKARSKEAAVAATLAFAVFAKKAIGDASDLEESVNAVNVTFGNSAGAILKIGESSAESFGLAKSEFNSFAVQFSSFAKKIAEQDGRKVSEVVGDITARVADFASVMNISVPEAAQVFSSTLAGETEPIKKFGKDISAAAVEQFALANGLIETKSELTETIKVTARYGLLMQQTADVQGDFAATSDSLANSQRILQAEMTDLSAKAGEDLAPALETVVTGLRSILDAADALKLGVVLDAFAQLDERAFAAGQSIRKFFGGDVMEPQLVDNVNAARRAVQDFDRSLFESFTTFDEVHAAGMKHAETLGLESDALSIANELAVEWSRNNVDATAAVEDNTEATKEAKSAADAHGAALGTLDWELGQLRSQTVKTERDISALVAAQEKARRETERLEAAHARLTGQLSDRSAFLGVEESLKAISEASDTTEADLLDVRTEVANYVADLGNVPAETLTEIDTLVNEGQYQEALARLRELERDRQTRVDIVTYYSQRGSPSAPVVQPNQGGFSHTGRRITPGDPVVPLSGEAWIADSPGRVVSREDLGHSPLNGTSSAPVVNNTIQIDVRAGMGADGNQVGRQIVDHLEEFYRNGGRPPKSAR